MDLWISRQFDEICCSGSALNSAVASRSAWRAAKCPKKQASKKAQRPCLDTQLDEVDLSIK